MASAKKTEKLVKNLKIGFGLEEEKVQRENIEYTSFKFNIPKRPKCKRNGRDFLE